MARKLRMESEAGVYHVLNRGNYKSPIFQSEKTKTAFLRCLGETCRRTDWLVHAWCIMSNHYHLAISTPRANLVEGMCWFQGTFASRFNRYRSEHGHLFQGRYKSLIVDPHEGLGPLCHYIHLNPVRARLCTMADLPAYRWTSLHWLRAGAHPPDWYCPQPAISHAGGLTGTSSDLGRYLEYLRWVAEDEPTRKRLRFDRMTRGWIIGSDNFAAELLREHQQLNDAGPRLAVELREAREALWRSELAKLLAESGRSQSELHAASKSAPWKVALAAQLKATTTVTNRWLSEHLNLGSLHEVSRKVSAWLRDHKPQNLAL